MRFILQESRQAPTAIARTRGCGFQKRIPTCAQCLSFFFLRKKEHCLPRDYQTTSERLFCSRPAPHLKGADSLIIKIECPLSGNMKLREVYQYQCVSKDNFTLMNSLVSYKISFRLCCVKRANLCEALTIMPGMLLVLYYYCYY